MRVQQAHTTTPFSSRSFPIKVVCDGLQSPANIGSLFRICEAFGVAEIIFCGAEINFESNRLLRTARGTSARLNYRTTSDIELELRKLKTASYLLIGLEITDESKPISTFTDLGTNIAIVLGNENSGVSSSALNAIDAVYHIEMYGKNSSMNVIHSLGIALYSITQKLKR